VQLAAPLKKAADAGIPGRHRRRLHRQRHLPDRRGRCRFPLSYIASDNVVGGEIAARALAKAIGEKGKVYVSSVKPASRRPTGARRASGTR